MVCNREKVSMKDSKIQGDFPHPFITFSRPLSFAYSIADSPNPSSPVLCRESSKTHAMDE